jgi:hypothetical protein
VKRARGRKQRSPLPRKWQPRESNAIDALVDALIPIARLMIRSGFGAGELVRATKLAFIRAAAGEVMPKGARLNVSRLSVVTGLTRKEISEFLRQQSGQRSRLKKPALEQRALRVLRGWRMDPLFHSAKGRPATLSMRGHGRAFPQLVSTYAGDVTPVSVLKELERMELVTMTSSGKLQMKGPRIRATAHASLQLSELARVFGDFANTASGSPTSEEMPTFFGIRESSVSSPEQASLFHRTFSRRAAMMLESIEQWVTHQQAAKQSAARVRTPKRRIGMGIYLINDSSRAN